ncbi:unnamed protein product, partial [Ambrosiozyma monospora]
MKVLLSFAVLCHSVATAVSIEHPLNYGVDSRYFSNPDLQAEPLVSVMDVKNHEESKHKFLEDYFQLDPENVLSFDDSVKLPPSLEKLASHSKITYPDPDDTSDLYPGAMDRYHGNALTGFLTYAHLPLEPHCFDPESYDDVNFDIAVLGATFDTGVSYRPGARFAPDYIRMGTRRLGQTYSPYRPGFNVFKNWAKIIDCGNPAMTPIDNRFAIDQLYRAERAALKHNTTDKNPSSSPRLVTLGGDHTITFSAIRAAHEKFGKIS